MSLKTTTPQEFRQKIACLETERKIEGVENSTIRNEAVRLISIMPTLFSDDLDRKTLWERIGNGIQVAIQKAQDDIELFISALLDYIKASSGDVAASEPLNQMLTSLMMRDVEFKKEFLRHISKRKFIILMLARDRWNEAKEKRIEL
jgi:hypothetical protein